MKLVKKNLYDVLINEIPIPDEQNIEWSQVLQIRADKHSIEKLKSFRDWVELDLNNYSEEQFTDILNKRIDEYKSSLKKHGIQVVVGGFTTILSSVGTILGAISSGNFALAGACCTITAGTINYTVDKFNSFNEVRKSPIAFYYDIIKKLN